MVLRSFLGVFCVLVPTAVFAQVNVFEIHLNGKTVGKDTYTIKKAKQGYEVTSRYSYAIAGYDGRFESDYRFDDNYVWTQAAASNMNTMGRYFATIDKARAELTIQMTRNDGASNAQNLPIRPDIELLPTLDPAGAQLLLLRAVTHPTPDNKYNIIVPSFGEHPGSIRGQAGAKDDPATAVADQLPSSSQSYDALWSKDRDVAGTLNGASVALHCYILTFGSYRWMFIADDTNNLMQVNVSPAQPNYVRQGFKLDPRDAAGFDDK